MYLCVCLCVRQAELFLPDVFLCFILLSAALSACHQQIHSPGVCICVCLRENVMESLCVFEREDMCACVCVCEINYFRIDY